MLELTQKLASFFEEGNPETVFSSIFNIIPYGIIIKNKHGEIVFANKEIEELLGYTNKDLVDLDILNDYDKLKNGENESKIRKINHKSGYKVPLEVNTFPILNNENKIYGELYTFKDLHEELLVSVIKLVNSSLALDKVLENTMAAAVEHLGLASNTIFLLNEEKTKLHLLSCTVFPNEEELKKVVFKVGEGIAGQVVQSRKPKYIENLHIEPGVSEQARMYHKDRSCMVYPLLCKDEILGVVTFEADNVRKFADKELALFENISNQVAIAVFNAQLFSILQHLSVTDGLTELYNHRYFQERIQEEINRALRNNGVLTLFMLDLDNFKRYNDIFGHVQGDELLRIIAKQIQKNVRNFDVVARYGGEEFAVILIDCPLEESLKIAERIRSSVEELSFFGSTAEATGKVTISIGVAMLQNSYSNRDLIYYADKALYKAKLQGKNRVELHIDS